MFEDEDYDPIPQPSFIEKILVLLTALYSAIFFRPGKQK